MYHLKGREVAWVLAIGSACAWDGAREGDILGVAGMEMLAARDRLSSGRVWS